MNLELRFAAHRARDDSKPSISRYEDGHQRMEGSHSSCEEIRGLWVEGETRASVLRNDARIGLQKTRPESVVYALDDRDSDTVTVGRDHGNRVT